MNFQNLIRLPDELAELSDLSEFRFHGNQNVPMALFGCFHKIAGTIIDAYILKYRCRIYEKYEEKHAHECDTYTFFDLQQFAVSDVCSSEIARKFHPNEPLDVSNFIVCTTENGLLEIAKNCKNWGGLLAL